MCLSTTIDASHLSSNHQLYPHSVFELICSLFSTCRQRHSPCVNNCFSHNPLSAAVWLVSSFSHVVHELSVLLVEYKLLLPEIPTYLLVFFIHSLVLVNLLAVDLRNFCNELLVFRSLSTENLLSLVTVSSHL